MPFDYTIESAFFQVKDTVDIHADIDIYFFSKTKYLMLGELSLRYSGPSGITLNT